MKERPILFNTLMVRALLEGRKTQTRRIAKICKDPDLGCELTPGELSRLDQDVIERACPHGRIGDRLWVRETWCDTRVGGFDRPAHYKVDIGNPSEANDIRLSYGLPWIPSIHMPRWASRITLEITGVRIERLQDITEEDAKAEGIEREEGSAYWKNYETGPGWRYWESPIQSFRTLWDSIYGGDPAQCWDANPWVWVNEFRRVEA